MADATVTALRPRRGPLGPDRPHLTPNRYRWGCRFDQCTSGGSAASFEQCQIDALAHLAATHQVGL